MYARRPPAAAVLPALAGSPTGLAETTAQRLKYHPAEFLLPWRMLRGEFTYTDATGTQRTCDLVAQELPAEGEPLATAVGHADCDRLLSALDTLQRQLAQAGLTHNNLKAANLWMTPDYRLLPLRYAYMRFDGGDDAPQFDALRAFVAEKASVAQMMCDTSAEYSAPCTAFRNHLWVGHMFEQMICVEDAEGYGYVDTQNRYLIAPQYRWANDFHEGRAEVQTADGRMGLIDKTAVTSSNRTTKSSNTTTGRDVCWPASTDVGPPSTTRAVNSPSSAP